MPGTDSAYQEGYLAYGRRASMGKNPYEEGTREYVSWDRGWIQGQLEEHENDE